MISAIYLSRNGARASIQIDCSARVNQNSQASKATVSLESCVLNNMYWRRRMIQDIITTLTISEG